MGNKMTFPLGYKVNITFLPVEPGTFVMGDEEEFNEYGWAEKPKHEVTISKRFWLGEFPVTRIQWQHVMGYKSYEYTGGINRPIENITWEEAQAFCKKMNERFGGQLPDGYEFFLPTEAQWEYACRTGLEAEYDLDAVAWYGKCMKTRPVGLKKPNKWGLYDMLGNVWEWCYDWYNAFPEDFKKITGRSMKAWIDPVGLGPQPNLHWGTHIAHGGHYHCKPEDCTPSNRKSLEWQTKSKHVGFRAAIRPVKGYSYWDEWCEIRDWGFALEEGECDIAGCSPIRWEHEDMYFSVYGDRRREDPLHRYFLIQDKYATDATRQIRVKFTSPEYVPYRNSDWKEDWILSADEKKRLMTYLTDNDCSLWKEIIYRYNWECFGANCYDPKSGDGIPEDLPVPDYTKLPDRIEK